MEDQLLLVDDNITLARDILSKEAEPDIPLSKNCRDPYNCGFWIYCTRDLPSPSVFDLYRTAFRKKLGYYERGLVSYEDLYSESVITKQIHRMQIDHMLSGFDLLFRHGFSCSFFLFSAEAD